MEQNEQNEEKASQFYVVHFLQEPFEGIDYYVCVPHTWIMIHRFTENMVVVAYPKNEDPFVTRERVKKKEKHEIEWAFCTADLKYESDSYDDAELWISKNNNNRPSVRKKSNTNGSTVPWDHELRSSKQNFLSKTKDKSKRTKLYKTFKQELPKHTNKESIIEAKRQLYLKRLNWLNETGKSTTQNADPQPVSSTEHSTTIRDEQTMESAQAGKTTAADGAKSTEGSSNSTEQVDDVQESSMVIDVDALSNDDVNIEDQSQQERPRENLGSQNLTATPKFPSPIDQTSQSSQNNNHNIRVKDVRTLIAPSNNQEPRVDDTSNTRQNTSQLTMSSLSPDEIENVRKNMAIAAQNSWNRVDPTQPLPKPVTRPSPAMNQNTVHQGSSVLIANNVNCAPVPGITTSSQGYQHISGMNTVLATDPRVVYSVASVAAPQNLPLNQNPIFVYQGVQQNLPVQQQYMQMPGQGLIQRPTTQTLDPRLPVQYHPISEFPQYQPVRPTFNNNPLNVSNQFHQAPEMQHQAPRAVNQRSQAPVYIPILPKNSRRSPTPQGVKKTPPPTSSKVPSSIYQALLSVLEEYPLNEQELQAILTRIPRDQSNPGLMNVLRNIAVLKGNCSHMSNMPVSSSDQSPRMEPSPVHRNVNQNVRPQAQQVDQFNEVNSTTKRVHFQDSGVRSAPQQMKVADSGYQTNVCTQEPLSSPYSAASVSGIETDHEAASSYEMSVDTAHETANETEHNSVDRTIAQNSLSTLVVQQQMMEKFAILCNQVSSTLQNTVNVFDSLRNSLLETAKSYQTFFDNERINVSENSASHAPSRNVAQEFPPVVEESQNVAPVRRNSNNGNQQGNLVSKVPEKTHQRDSKEQPHSTQQVILPPEYDANDTKWTLKFRNHMTGLVELLPNSNIYVRYSELKHCEQETKCSQSLAQMMLHEVFNEKALGVCASMTEIVKVQYQSSPDARPALDNHGSLVLLNYVIQYSFKSKWSADVVKILHTLDLEVKKMRYKYSVKSRC